jgi:TolB protein
VIRLACLIVLIAAAACQGPGVPPAEFVARPIALNFLDAEQSRRRAEFLAETEQGRPPSKRGVARVSDVARYVEFLAGNPGAAGGRFVGRLALLDAASGTVTPIAAALPGAMPVARSADGDRLLFAQPVGEYLQLFELRHRTGEVRRMTRGPLVHPQGCYGPEGRLVTMTAGVEGGRAVSRIEISGPGRAGPQPISGGPLDHSPACAPDGSAVAWVERDPRGRESLLVRTLPLEGEPARLGPGRDPSFSPDGQWIVYSARAKGVWSLYRVRPDGSGRARIGIGTADQMQPAVSPDGRLVIYVAQDGHFRRLYLRRFDGSGDRILLDDGDAEQPVW